MSNNNIKEPLLCDADISCTPVKIVVCGEEIMCPWFQSSLWTDEKTITLNNTIQSELFGWAEEIERNHHGNVSFIINDEGEYSTDYRIYLVDERFLSIFYDYYYSYTKNMETVGEALSYAIVFDVKEEVIVHLNDLLTIERGSKTLLDKAVPILYTNMEMEEDEAYAFYKKEIDYVNSVYLDDIISECNISLINYLRNRSGPMANKSFFG